MFRYNDEELLYLSRQGCPIAREQLCQQYYQYVEMLVRKNSFYGDIGDIIQVVALACMQAFDAYRPDRQCRLKTFMTTVIKNNMVTALKRRRHEDKKITCFSLDDSCPHATYYRYEDVVADSKVDYQPSRALLVKETTESYYGHALERCSKLEQEVMQYRMDGYSHDDIARTLQIDVKAIYNALYRVQQKLIDLKSI